jgi:hypothetical protein
MLTDETEKKIPCFLLTIAPTIFKAGSSVHLLTREEILRSANESMIRRYHNIDLYF